MSFTVRRLPEEDSGKPRKSLWKPVALSLLSIGGAAASIYERQKGQREQQKSATARSLYLKKGLLVLVAIFCAFAVFAGTIKLLVSMHIVSLDTIASVTGSAPLSDEYGHTNILLLGQGHDEHDGKNLTDTIMVASIDPKKTKSAVLISLPRDLYFLSTEKMGKGKLNSMYRDYSSYLRFQKGMEEKEASMEAIQELGQEIGRNLGMEIHYSAKIDFIGFVKGVDTLGGIDIDVPYDIVDTEFPDNAYGYETFEIRKGQQHLDGETALKYARSRHTTSDFDRSARQQQILSAVAQKAKTAKFVRDPKKIVSLMRLISEHLETTMPMNEVIGLADAAQDIERSRIIAFQLNDRNGLYDGVLEPGGFLYTPPRNLFDGASVLLPVSIPEFPVTWKQIQTLVKLMVNERAAHLAKPEFSVLNSSAKSGTARRLANELKRYGFNIAEIANASSAEQTTSTISMRYEEDEALATFFAALLGIEVAPLPADLPEDEQGRFTIILGEDFSYAPLQDLIANLL